MSLISETPVEDRCVDPASKKIDYVIGDSENSSRSSRLRFSFDEERGRVYIPLRVVCQDDLPGGGFACDVGHYDGHWVAAISGFTTTLDILEDQLPEGPPGPPGPQGEQGPPGPLIPACPDDDGDAWADCSRVPVCNPYGHPCGDCDDRDSTVNPGASEVKPSSNKHDGKDNDCNGQVDDF